MHSIHIEGAANVRRWLIATGVVVFALIVARCTDRNERPNAQVLAVAVARHDSLSHVREFDIQQDRAIAGAAARGESTAIAHARAKREIAIPSEWTANSSFAPRDESDTLIAAILAAQDSALAFADVRAASLNAALDLSELRAAESDSLLHAAVRAVDAPCRILRIVPCPSRVQTAVLGGVVVAALLRR